MAGFYDEMKVYSEQDIEKILEISERFGLSGMIFTHKFDKASEFTGWKGRIKEKIKNKKMKILYGAEIEAKSNPDLDKKISSARQICDVILVANSNDEVNHSAAQDSRVDILKLVKINQVLAKFAFQNKISIEISLQEILSVSGLRRARLIEKLMSIVKVGAKYKTSVIISSSSQDNADMRAPRERISIGMVLGMTPANLEEAVCWQTLIKKIEQRQDQNFICEGARILKRTK